MERASVIRGSSVEHASGTRDSSVEHASDTLRSFVVLIFSSDVLIVSRVNSVGSGISLGNSR